MSAEPQVVRIRLPDGEHVHVLLTRVPCVGEAVKLDKAIYVVQSVLHNTVPDPRERFTHYFTADNPAAEIKVYRHG